MNIDLQAKIEFQRVLIKLTEERLQHEAAVVEYKQVCVGYGGEMVKLYFFFFLQLFKKLDEGHQKQKEELSQELIEVKVYNNICH